MKKYVFFMMATTIMAINVFAQDPGGHVRRPIKKQPTTTDTTPTKERRMPKKDRIQKPSKPSSEAVIQRLIKNMVLVEGGTFTMGSSQKDDVWTRGKPRHEVTVSSFMICKFEVTQEEWQAVMGNNPSFYKGAKLPVNGISWYECQEFIRKLNSMTEKHFRLPTEAEWEYAARGGKKSNGYIFAGGNNPDNVMWHIGNKRGKLHAVGLKRPNELGLYDMSGNILEWCQDWYEKKYNTDNKTNPKGPENGKEKVLRGGDIHCGYDICGVSDRFYYSPDYGSSTGFRLAE